MNPKPSTTVVSHTEPPLAWWSATVPVAMGYVPLGAVFGFLFVQAGGSAELAVLTSLVVYAGADRFPLGAGVEAIGLRALMEVLSEAGN